MRGHKLRPDGTHPRPFSNPDDWLAGARSTVQTRPMGQVCSHGLDALCSFTGPSSPYINDILFPGDRVHHSIDEDRSTNQTAGQAWITSILWLWCGINNVRGANQTRVSGSIAPP